MAKIYKIGSPQKKQDNATAKVASVNSSVLSLNQRIKRLIDTGALDLHGVSKCTKPSEVISVVKRFYPYINSDGVFLSCRKVYRANGDCYLRFSRNTNMTNLQITNCIVALRNSETRNRNNRIKKQIIVDDEFRAVDYTPLEESIIETLRVEHENDMLFSYNPTPEARMEYYKEKARRMNEKYEDVMKIIQKKQN